MATALMIVPVKALLVITDPVRARARFRVAVSVLLVIIEPNKAWDLTRVPVRPDFVTTTPEIVLFRIIVAMMPVWVMMFPANATELLSPPRPDVTGTICLCLPKGARAI